MEALKKLLMEEEWGNLSASEKTACMQEGSTATEICNHCSETNAPILAQAEKMMNG